jgi:hypothetical protein
VSGAVSGRVLFAVLGSLWRGHTFSYLVGEYLAVGDVELVGFVKVGVG